MAGAAARREKAKENQNNLRSTAFIAEFRKSNISLAQIAEQLNKNGFRISTDKIFRRKTVQRVINNL
ncbi:hypothetical protein EHT25_03355 [Larkinella rosea]|uniref:Recombinase domain-containing protein n=1 Tax=Larkinella rosea TaxID=2025312 RepID=A0A3P1C3D6_9BACT|nr:hypothetical protein EHT25_03355 [Larkinella rosea]